MPTSGSTARELELHAALEQLVQAAIPACRWLHLVGERGRELESLETLAIAADAAAREHELGCAIAAAQEVLL